MPISDQEDIDVEITPLGQGRFGLTPYPFVEDDLEVICRGRYLQPIDSRQVDLGQILADLPIAEQRFTLMNYPDESVGELAPVRS